MIVLSIIFLRFMCYICFSQFSRKPAATRGTFN
jgi:hypothetical protein